MDFNEYQQWTSKSVIYPTGTNQEALTYCTLGLNGEAGEVAEKIKKWMRDGTFNPQSVAYELGDVLYYLARCAAELGYNLESIASMNMAKLDKRRLEGKLGGSGDAR
jgi:NTP pyrophosphatase (non-canonical NTP hydrolase)